MESEAELKADMERYMDMLYGVDVLYTAAREYINQNQPLLENKVEPITIRVGGSTDFIVPQSMLVKFPRCVFLAGQTSFPDRSCAIFKCLLQLMDGGYDIIDMIRASDHRIPLLPVLQALRDDITFYGLLELRNPVQSKQPLVLNSLANVTHTDYLFKKVVHEHAVFTLNFAPDGVSNVTSTSVEIRLNNVEDPTVNIFKVFVVALGSDPKYTILSYEICRRSCSKLVLDCTPFTPTSQIRVVFLPGQTDGELKLSLSDVIVHGMATVTL